MLTDLLERDIQPLGSSDGSMIGDRPSNTRGNGQVLIEIASASELVC